MAHSTVAPRARHLGPLALFAALTVGWTWPLALHLRDAIPGAPGDNYTFLWYFWWMRHVLATPGESFFHTNAMFYPFGASLAVTSHSALPGFVAATVLGRASIATSLNVILLAYAFANMAAAYALAYDIAESVAPAIVAGVIFGLSPYVAAHFPGHFELVAVWTLPAFAFCLRRSCRRSSVGWAVAAGLAAVATAYTSYYYFIYEALFALVYLLAWSRIVAVDVARRPVTATLGTVRRALLSAAALLAAAASWIAVTGGGVLDAGGIHLSATRPQGALAIMWVMVLAWAACTWSVHLRGRRRDGVDSVPPPSLPWIAVAAVAGIALAGAVPLLWQAARLMMSGDYVTPTYFWRSAPRGVDALAPLLGPPAHSLVGALSARAYETLRLDPIEAVGWLGVAPVCLLFLLRRAPGIDTRERRAWIAVAIVFALWALGPFLTIGGFDTGLRLPVILARWIPFVANARMPGRAMVVVFLAIAMLAAMAARAMRAPLAWGIALVVAAEFWIAPIPLTYLDAPAVYQTLAAAPPGGVCEVPLGVGDGLSPGVGSHDRSRLFYATLHEHPLVGGYLGRMPTNADGLYEAMPIVGALLRLSDGRPAGPTDSDTRRRESPCTYLVVRRAASSPALLAYVDSLPADRLADSDGLELLRLR